VNCHFFLFDLVRLLVSDRNSNALRINKVAVLVTVRSQDASETIGRLHHLSSFYIWQSILFNLELLLAHEAVNVVALIWHDVLLV
jgi:hypothetical protein